MSPGPLRRLAGACGLLGLVPTAVLLGTGALPLVDAALRAGATLLAVVVIGRLAGWGLGFMAAELERTGRPENAAPDAQPRRRADDRAGTAAD